MAVGASMVIHGKFEGTDECDQGASVLSDLGAQSDVTLFALSSQLQP